MSGVFDPMPDIRIFGNSKGSSNELDRFMSFSVPRVGDHVCIQYWSAKVYRVEWTIISGRPHVDVFCDTEEMMRRVKQIERRADL